MALYSLTIKKSVEKDFRKIPKDLLPNLFEHIEKLALDPVPPESYKLAGAENLYRLRIGDYRVIYRVLHSAREVTVFFVRHRSHAYRGL